MITIKQLLNKIKWDEREKPEQYVFFYKDRFLEELQPLKHDEIVDIEGTFMKVFNGEEIISIPLHRVKKVKKSGKVIWERNA